MPRVLVTVPNMGWLRRELMQSLLNCAMDGRYETSFHLPSNVPLENSQHQIIRKLLDEKYDFWLNFDDDTIPQFNPLDLVELDKDIIGMPYPLFTATNLKGYSHLHWASYDMADDGSYEQHKPMDGLQEVDAVGGGCFLIARRVFEGPVMQKGAFTRFTNEHGIVTLGNDLSFCKRAKDCGFRIFCHYDYPCTHIKEIDLTQVVLMVNKAAGVANVDSTEGQTSGDHGAVETPEPVNVG